VIDLEPARAQHVPAIQKLWKEFMDFHAARNDHYLRSDDGDTSFGEYVTRLLGSADACVLVAVEGTDVLGYALGKIERYAPGFRRTTFGLIADVAVTARARRRGLGARFDVALRAWFREKGIRRVQLRASADNEVSLAFWKQRGYRPFVITFAADLED